MDGTLKKVFRTISPILIYLIIERVVGFGMNLMYILNRLKGNLEITDELDNQLRLELYDMQSKNVLLISAIVALVSICIFYPMIKKEWAKRPYIIEAKGSLMKAYLSVALISIGFTISVNLLINAWGLFKYDWDFAEVSRLIYYEPLFMQFIVIGLIVPVCEELLFRGIVFERISQSGKTSTAIFLTSLLFALFHGTWIQIIYAFAFSFLMLYAYQKCGSFRAPLIFHIVSNLSSLLLRQMPTLSTMGYSIGIVVFVLVGIAGILVLKQDKYYRKVYSKANVEF